MLKHRNRKEIIGVKVINEGTPLDGAHVFRNPAAAALFDKMRNDRDLSDYGIADDGRIYFQLLNGVVKYYTRREFIKIAENNNDF